MSDIREASLREVLAEVSILDLGAASKSIVTYGGCLVLVVGMGALIETAGAVATGGYFGSRIPWWAFCFFWLWLLTGFYTETKSYHRHVFEWYFPKLGWLGSLPLVAYITAGIEIYRHFDPEVEFFGRLLGLTILAIWWFPVFLGLSILDIGHKRLMEKRVRLAEELQPEGSNHRG